MRTPFFSVLVILALIPLVPSILSDPLNQPLGDFIIPAWVKNTASWWSDDKIPDSSFIETIEFLIKNEIITVEVVPDLDSEVTNEIPTWVKNTAGWWSDDKIPDVTFVASIKYLMSQGIIHVEREQVEESEKCTFKGFEVVCSPVKKYTEEIKEFHIAVNDGDCCLNWAHVGEEYRFQIKIFDEFRGSPTDDVTTTAKIISKDGELRHHFGMITTEDGIYRGSIIIPSIDWYAGNILSVTGQYNGAEKTIEKEFEVFMAKNPGAPSYIGQIISTVEINDYTTNGPVLFRSGYETNYGTSVANIGDLDGDGVNDLAVGQTVNQSSCTSQIYKGAVQIHFLNADGTVKSTKELCESTTGIANFNGARFGSSIAGLGDIDGDGTPDIAVGAFMTETNNRGEIDIILMNSDGSVKDQVRHRGGSAQNPTDVGILGGGTQLGYSVENIGDLNGDGINDIAMGGWNCDCGGANDSGLVLIGFLESDGGFSSVVEIKRGTTNGPSLTTGDAYGTGIANIGDLDGDGIQDIAVSSEKDDGNSSEIHIHFMNTDGSIDSTVALNDDDVSELGTSVSVAIEGLGDIDGDGIGDMAVGLDGRDLTGTNRGSVLFLYMNEDGSVKSTAEFNDSSSNGPTLTDGDFFGVSIANMGDLDGYAKFNIEGTSFKADLDSNNVIELAVGATGDDMDSDGDSAGATNRGAAHILFLE